MATNISIVLWYKTENEKKNSDSDSILSEFWNYCKFVVLEII